MREKIVSEMHFFKLPASWKLLYCGWGVTIAIQSEFQFMQGAFQ
jgi:hypothetical protein